MGITADSDSHALVDPAVFQSLQAKIDEDASVREELKNILQNLEKQGRSETPPCLISLFLTDSIGRVTQSILSRVHSIPAAQHKCPFFERQLKSVADLDVQFRIRLRRLGIQLRCNL